MRWLSIFIIAILLTQTIAIAHGESCAEDTCVGVVAEDGNRLVLTVRKGKAGSESSTAPKPEGSTNALAAAKRKPWIPWWPLREKKVSAPSPRPTKKVSRVRKPRVKKVAAVSLAEQVSKMLPSGTIITQPTSAILINEPVNFITTVPKSFQTVIVVLEVPIHLDLRAKYLWDFGNGSSIESLLPGAPYPATLITNSYSHPGSVKVKLEVVWSGTWRAGALSGPITGSMRSNFERELMIHAADTRLNQ